MRTRVGIGIILSVIITNVIYWNLVRIGYSLMVGALFYDYYCTYRVINYANINYFEYYWVFAFITNLLMVYLYRVARHDLITMIIVIQGSDTIQYLIGSTFGRYRIGSISPRKTWEGYISAIVFFGLVSFVVPSMSCLRTIVYCILGILGGLLASLVKRTIGVKDFSNLLGPHGGWMDRTDSLYLATCWLYLII